jgi:hypothetical protein
MTETVRMHAVVPIEKSKDFWRSRTVPIATASSRKISGAVALIHRIVWMVGVSPGGFLVFDLTVEIPGTD